MDFSADLRPSRSPSALMVMADLHLGQGSVGLFFSRPTRSLNLCAHFGQVISMLAESKFMFMGRTFRDDVMRVESARYHIGMTRPFCVQTIQTKEAA